MCMQILLNFARDIEDKLLRGILKINNNKFVEILNWQKYKFKLNFKNRIKEKHLTSNFYKNSKYA